MAEVATRRIKYRGKWFMPSDEVPVTKADLAELTGRGFVVRQVSQAEAERVQRMQERLAALTTEVEDATAQITAKQAEAEALAPAFADLKQLRAAATRAEKGEDEQARADTAAAVRAAEEAEAAHKALAGEIAALVVDRDAKVNTLKQLEG